MTTLSHSKEKGKKSLTQNCLLFLIYIIGYLRLLSFSLFIKLIELPKIASIKTKPRKTSPKHLKQFRITTNNNYKKLNT